MYYRSGEKILVKLGTICFLSGGEIDPVTPLILDRSIPASDLYLESISPPRTSFRNKSIKFSPRVNSSYIYFALLDVVFGCFPGVERICYDPDFLLNHVPFCCLRHFSLCLVISCRGKFTKERCLFS